MVRLGDEITILEAERDFVSIPVWFDWEITQRVQFDARFAKFQFQYGSIGSDPSNRNNLFTPSRFNSSMVRLGASSC